METPNPKLPDQHSLENLLYAHLREQRTNRRWRIFFRLTVLTLILIVLIAKLIGTSMNSQEKHIAMININGEIGMGHTSSAEHLVKSLDHAFANKQAQAIILNINSGGGSAVASSEVYDEIMRLRKKYPNKAIVSICNDICASGAYYIASASQHIYANRASIIGSIGVAIESFGFTGLMHKYGVERRLLSAGKNKSIMDPFSPLSKEERDHLQQDLDLTHQDFIQAVKRGRGKRLAHDPAIFSGLIWNGINAKRLGLIDGFMSPWQLVREKFHDLPIEHYDDGDSLFSRLSKHTLSWFSGNGIFSQHAPTRINMEYSHA